MQTNTTTLKKTDRGYEVRTANGELIGVVRKVEVSEPVMTNDRGYYYSVGTVRRTEWTALLSPAYRRNRGDHREYRGFTRRADAVEYLTQSVGSRIDAAVVDYLLS